MDDGVVVTKALVVIVRLETVVEDVNVKTTLIGMITAVCIHPLHEEENPTLLLVSVLPPHLPITPRNAKGPGLLLPSPLSVLPRQPVTPVTVTANHNHNYN